jgi:hypothetical protein
MAEKQFTVDVDAMLAMQVERAGRLSKWGEDLMLLASKQGMPEKALPAGELALGCLKAANTIERGVLEDYHATRNTGADSSPDLQMIAEYLAEHHMDEIKEGETVGQATVKLLEDYEEQLSSIRRD